MSLDRVDYKLQSGSKVEVEKSALPDGASTEAKQEDIISSLAGIDSTLDSVEDAVLSRGGQSVQNTYDLEQNMLLSQILTQLKIMNTYLSEWQGEVIKTQDI